MKILFDHQTFTLQKFGGISKYFIELLNQFNLTGDKCNVAVLYSDNIYLNKKAYYNFIVLILKNHFKGRNKIINFLNITFNKYKLIQSDFDVFHPTYYDPYFLRYCKKPFVITVHDLIHEKYLIHLNSQKFLADKRELLEKASRIIAISNTTKSDIVSIYKIDETKIDVIHHGVNESFNNIKTRHLNLPKRYVLFMGQRNEYKNFNFFIKALKSVLDDDNELHLVCSGIPFNKKEIELIEDLGLTIKVHHFDASEIQLPSLYANSVCFVFPSIYEGFGMPILEAFATKTPCLLSDTPCFREIAADAALFFKLDDFDDFKEQISKILYYKSIKEILVNKGTERLSEFSWQRTKALTLESYKKAISSYEK
ncbi:glycosyltransferase family 4 protein [Flavobacterium franklandianum]|uniref:Glycosyltransferase family 4 protein n=1 Tax=Flavobacterium franklandianum TaxID=2594430 RepID=A0A553C623_9FLAO|nr:glycosyltransferase family 1 protein [Flavobacterium franklandianum]TRX15852.1 glycosyltransferase family 4 protein [Flavobacterium franklandianum]